MRKNVNLCGVFLRGRAVAKHFVEQVLLEGGRSTIGRAFCRSTVGRGGRSMGGAVKQAYREVLKLVKRLPPQARGYYTQYARENFITYSEPQDAATVRELLARAHRHSCWILKKYGVDEAAANRLKEICFTDHVQNPA